jgi:hypothetical protein
MRLGQIVPVASEPYIKVILGISVRPSGTLVLSDQMAEVRHIDDIECASP